MLNKHFINIPADLKKWHCFKFIIIIYLVISFSQFSFAQHITDTLRIKPILIYTQSMVKEEAGRTSTKIDSVSMIKSLTSSLSDLISQNTPIFMKDYGRGAMATASFRGTAPSHTQVTWNGIPLSSPMLGMVDFSTIPVYFTDNVNLLHGSGSLSELSGALGGIVKLENTADWQKKFSIRLLSGTGSYGTYDEFIKLTTGNSKIQSQTRAFYNYSNNDYPFVNKLIANLDPITGKYLYPTQRNLNSQYCNYGLLQEFYVHPTNKTIVTVRYWYQHNNRSLPRLLSNETDINANINIQSENAHRVVGEYKYYGNKGTFDLHVGSNIQLSTYLLRNKVSGNADQIVTNSHSNSATYLFKANYVFQFNKNLSLSTSANSIANTVNSVNSPSNSSSTGYDVNRLDHSISLQLSKSFNDRLSANLMAREEIIGGKSVPLIPSLGVEYRPFKTANIYYKGSIARNYHQPTLNDLYYIPGGNPKLKAEEGIMADLGTGYSGFTGNLSFHTSLSAYISEINNWIIWLPTPQGYWEPYNMKRVNTGGVEINAGIKGKLGITSLNVNGNYAYTSSVNRDDPRNWADESVGKQLPFIPKNSANLVVNLSRSDFHLTWLWNYYSERYTTSSNDKTSRFDVLYPYIMNNLYIGREFRLFKGTFDIELKILNLFNESYRTVLQNPMPGRNYSLLFRYDF